MVTNWDLTIRIFPKVDKKQPKGTVEIKIKIKMSESEHIEQNND